MRLLIIGYGRMGKMVEGLSAEFGMQVAGRIDIDNVDGEWPDADVAIDFSAADAVPGNVARLGGRGIDIVIGTTGWGAHEAAVRREVETHGIGVVSAPNFALGVNLFVALTERAAELMAAQAEKRGIAGIVIYGSIRDYDTLHAGTFPVFAAGVTHRGPYKDGPGEINVLIAIDGMVIAPGDLIVGDGDGIVCVPFEVTEEVLKATQAKHAAEIKQLAAIKEGKVDRAWVDAALTRLGCKIHG